MTQTEQVIKVMRELGGVATFGKLNATIDFSSWATKTPEASVRRIVQNSEAFFRIRPGLWGLKEFENEILRKFRLDNTDKEADNEFSHSYYQGLVVEIGKLREMQTYVPSQDKNKLFIDRQLKELVDVQEIYQFTYPEIIRHAKTVDVIWFNERKLPYAFFEVEHSTDIQNSLLKFYELQDFNAKFYIVADGYRIRKFDELLSRSVFKLIRDRVVFQSYDTLSEIHNKEYRRASSRVL